MAYAFVQQKEGSAAGGSVSTVDTGTTTSPIVAGNTLLASVTWDTFAAEVVTLSDLSGTNDTWTQIGTEISQSGRKIRLYRLENAAAGTLNLRASLSPAGGNAFIAAWEFSGLDPAGFDQTAQNNQFNPGVGTDAVTTGNTPSLTGQPALVFGFQREMSGFSPIVGTGFTDLGLIWGGDGLAEHKRVTSTSPVAATYTAGGTNDVHLTFVATFREAAEPPIEDQPETLHVIRSGIRLR